MTRVEKDIQATGEIKQMKEDVIKEVRKSNRTTGSKMTCSIIVLFLVVVAVFIALWIVASTGLVSIPLFSRVAYKPLEPTRVVFAGTPVDVIANETFQTTIARKLEEGGGDLLDKNVSLKIREESLTATIKSAFEESGLTFIDGTNAQVVIRKNGSFEFFVPLNGYNSETSMMLNLSAQIDNGNVVLEIGKLKIGAFTVPKSIVTLMIGKIVTNELSSLNSVIGSYMKINAIIYNPGELEFQGELTVEVIK